jgi:hypothetical protein
MRTCRRTSKSSGERYSRFARTRARARRLGPTPRQVLPLVNEQNKR